MIGKKTQEVRIIVEVTRPSYVGVTRALPHIAIDNMRMIDCLPEPVPFGNGTCMAQQAQCRIMRVSVTFPKSRAVRAAKLFFIVEIPNNPERFRYPSLLHLSLFCN